MASEDCIATVEIAGVEYAAREHRYQATVLQLADRFSVAIPAPGGKVGGVPVLDVARMGDPVVLYLADPEVKGGAKIPKLRGRVTARSAKSDANGCVLSVTGADLGWHLSTCGEVSQNERGLTWGLLASRFLGLTVDPVTGAVLKDAYGWGFKGVGGSNVYNRKIRLGRQAAEQHLQEEQLKQGLRPPRIQVEVGETLDQLIIRLARLGGLLVNVSTDGWLQIFRPAWDGVTLDAAGQQKAYTAPVQYTFTHPGNILKDTLSFDEDAAQMYTHVECWNTVIDTTLLDPFDPNAGRYHGSYDPTPAPLPFERRLTFSDPEQYGTDPVTHASRVNARAKWQWQRNAFDAQTITFEVQGHSQNGVPYVEDSLASFTSEVLGIDGVYYVAAVECTKKLARAGFDTGAGSRTKITLKPSGLLAA